MDTNEITKPKVQQKNVVASNDSLIDFEKLHSALNAVNLLNCQGSIVRVTGLTVESTGPGLGLGELCNIHLRDG